MTIARHWTESAGVLVALWLSVLAGPACAAEEGLLVAPGGALLGQPVARRQREMPRVPVAPPGEAFRPLRPFDRLVPGPVRGGPRGDRPLRPAPDTGIDTGIAIAVDNASLLWRVRDPGTYAARVCTITVEAAQPVMLLVGSSDGNLSTADGTDIPTWYSFGDTVAAAEANGWTPAADFAGIALPVLPISDERLPKTVTLWCKIETTVAGVVSGSQASFDLTVLPAPSLPAPSLTGQLFTGRLWTGQL